MYLRDESDRLDNPYEKIKVLAVNEENLERMLPAWGSSKNNDTGLSLVDSDKPDEEQVRRVSEVYKAFLDAANEKKDDIRKDGFTSSLKADFVKRVAPSQDDLSIVICSKFPTVQEYCQIFFEEEELVLESEISFPQPPYLSEYLDFRDQPYFTYNGFKG